MAKPIALLYLPMDLGSGRRTEWSDCNSLMITFEKSYPDYYWIMSPKESITEIELQVFHEKNFTEIQYEELKQLIEKSIPK